MPRRNAAGARKIPARERRSLPCIHEGPVLEWCHTCTGERGHIRDCDLHERCTRGDRKKSVKCCLDCGDFSTGSQSETLADIVIEQGAGGIGDGLLGLLAVARLKADNPGKVIEYRVSALALPFVAMFEGYDILSVSSRQHNERPVKGALQLNLGYTQENRDKFPVARWERYASNIGASGVALPALRQTLETTRAGYVLLCPYSTDDTREWSLHHWLTLERLLMEAGYSVAIVRQESENAAGFASEPLIGDAKQIAAGMLGLFTAAYLQLLKPRVILLGFVGVLLDLVFRKYRVFPSLDGYYGAMSYTYSAIWGAIPMVLPYIVYSVTTGRTIEF